MSKRRITQETFDAVVRENMEEFEMDPDEALREAALESLRVGKDTAALPDVTADIKCFTEQCSLGFARRYLAAQKGAYPIILSYCKKNMEEQDSVLAALSALAALTDGQPDLLDEEGRQFLLDVLQKYQVDSLVTCAAICVVRHCCIKHEQNRQDLVKGGVLPLLTGAITRHSGSAELVKEASSALRVMTFDDDVRVTFGHAHEHAKSIVLEHSGLKILIEAAKGKASKTVELVRQVLSAIRAIAGNDDVKDAVVNAGGVDLIVIAMNRHTSNPAVCEQGCACLSVLALRKPNNCKVIMENGAAIAAVQAMKTHPDAANVQVYCKPAEWNVSQAGRSLLMNFPLLSIFKSGILVGFPLHNLY
ncbi:hypothetical protein GOODEAATRI_011312 [Goodea atripinnis]|uniref:Armadillo repeat-containing protein 6 n=1 Tax=Goodea atripinnis TaxID=208336 RepID=A0ABV0N9S2_9TELE